MIGGWVGYILCAVVGGVLALIGVRRLGGGTNQREVQGRIKEEAERAAAAAIDGAKSEHAVTLVALDTVADDIATADLEELARLANGEFGGEK